MNKMEVADEIESKMEGAAVKEENSRLWEQLEEARSAESLLVLSMDQFLQEHGIKVSPPLICLSPSPLHLPSSPLLSLSSSPPLLLPSSAPPPPAGG